MPGWSARAASPSPCRESDRLNHILLAAPSIDLDQIDPTLSAWDIVLAILILIVSWIVSRAAGRAVRSITRRLEGIPPELAVLAARVVRYFFIVLGIGMALTALGADMQPVLAATLVVGIAAALSLRGIAENFAAGVVLQTSHPISAGDVVDIKGYTGTVREINGRAVVIETFDGAVVHVPNSDTLDSPIVNRSTTAGRRSSVEVRADRTRVPTEQLMASVDELTTAVNGVLAEPAVATSLTGIDETHATLLVTFWHHPSASTSVTSNVVTAIARAHRARSDSLGHRTPAAGADAARNDDADPLTPTRSGGRASKRSGDGELGGAADPAWPVGEALRLQPASSFALAAANSSS